MLIPGIVEKIYTNYIKIQNFLDSAKNIVGIVESFKLKELNELFQKLDIKSSSKLAKRSLELLSGGGIDSIVQSAIDKIPYSKAKDIDSIIDYVMDSIDIDLRSISDLTTKSLNKEYPFIDTEIEFLKDGLFGLVSDKIHNLLTKKKKLTSVNFKNFNYNLQIEMYTKLIEKIIHQEIKASTIIIPTGGIIVQTVPTGGPAANIQPIILQSVLK